METNELVDPDSLPVLDADWVVRDMGQDIEGYREVASIFLEDIGVSRAGLLAGVDGAAVVLLPLIHELANSLGVIGARRGTALVRRTEHRLRSGESLTAQEVVHQSVDMLDEAEAALRAWMAQQPRAPVAD